MLAAFTILFGTRHLDATERHEGMVAAIAFESLVKLLAFLAVGVFVTFGIYDGFGDIFDARRGGAQARVADDAWPTAAPTTATGASLTFLSMLSIMLLPRQFQIAVVENVNEQHLAKAIWLFPLYLLLINIFVLPITFAGLLHFPDGSVDADTFVLTLPMAEQQAGAGAVRVHRRAFGGHRHGDRGDDRPVHDDLQRPGDAGAAALDVGCACTSGGPLRAAARRSAAGRSSAADCSATCISALRARPTRWSSIGLISFAAVAQFAPAMLGGMYWKGGTRAGAHRRPSRRFRGVGLHAAAAVVRQIGLAAVCVHRAGTVRHRAAQAASAVRADGAGRDSPRDVLEHARQRRRLRGRVAVRAPERRASTRRRRCSSTCSAVPPRRRLARVAREALGGGSVSAGRPLPRAGARRRGLRAAMRAAAWPGFGRRACSADAELVHFAETLLAGAIGAPRRA